MSTDTGHCFKVPADSKNQESGAAILQTAPHFHATAAPALPAPEVRVF
jgi:hypothetical protein